MKPLQDPFRQLLADSLSQTLEEKLDLKLAPELIIEEFATVPDINMGHLAFPCFRLAKDLKMKPNEIAQKIALSWQAPLLVDKIAAAGPYLNIFISGLAFEKYLLLPMIDESYFKVEMDSSASPYLVEYSQPNTHKELHVGHMRNLCYGLALVNLFEYCGNPVVPCTFPGDVGTHVAKCLWYYKYHNKESVPNTKRGQWLGQLYTNAHNKLESEKGTPQEDSNRKQLTEILVQLEKGSGEFFDLWQETRQWSIDLMNQVYDWADVSFERWFWESEVDSPSVKLIQSLKDKGQLEEDQGAIGLRFEDEKLGFCMFLKSDGTGLYATKDLELARRKFAEYNPQANIVIVDMRQELHFKQVFKAFEILGLGKASQCIHLKYNFVELPDGAMSSRKGNIVPITDLIEKMKNTIITNYLDRYREEWTPQDIESTASKVAQGAIKYGMNNMDPNKKIVFDMNEWLRLDGESGPYIQYTHARICSLLKKFKWDQIQPAEGEESAMSKDAEKQLLVQLSSFQLSMHRALKSYKSSIVCTYIYELAKSFNSFYQACPIGTAENQQQREFRLNLALATQKALKVGLGLLGIPAPTKM